jgi:hypothetical protein
MSVNCIDLKIGTGGKRILKQLINPIQQKITRIVFNLLVPEFYI